MEDYIDIARRHKAWIFGPAFLAIVGTVVGAFLWPDTYESSATIKVNPQQIPTNFVQSNVNQQLQDRISGMAQTILSRNMLQGLIQTHGLYKKELQKRPIDDVVEEMRRNIQIGSVSPLGGKSMAQPSSSGKQNLAAFEISFEYTDRFKAQQIVRELAGNFVTLNLTDRSRDSKMTSSLLRDNWNRANSDLQAAEAKLAEFRSRNQGRLPDEMQSNLSQMSGIQSRLSTLNESISRVNQERLTMEGMLRIYKTQIDEAKQPRTQRTQMQVRKSEKLADMDKDIRQMEDVLVRLRERYKDTHPDVQRMVATLNAAKQRRDALAKEEAASDSSADQPTETAVVTDQSIRDVRDLEAKYRETENRIAALNLQAQDTQREIDRLSGLMRSFEARLQGTPFSEQEYTELLRARDVAKANFDDLTKKVSSSSLADEMESRKQGESLEMLDQASLPMTPIKPKRMMIIGIGTAVGLIVGFALAGLREVKDTSLKNLKDVRAYTQMPLLGSIPLLENDLVIKRRRRIAWLGWALACLAGVAIMSGSIIYYYATKA